MREHIITWKRVITPKINLKLTLSKFTYFLLQYYVAFIKS